jgi:hypothetical protein
MTPIQEFGVSIIEQLQTFHPTLDGAMAVLAVLVKPEYFLVFILPFLYWNFDKRMIIKLLIAALIDISFGEILRIALAQPRPWWIADLVPIDAVTSVYSSPAGYSSFSVLFFGFIAYHFNKQWVTISCVSIIILTSIAKLYEAATLPDHLLLGALQGGLLLYVFIKYGDKVTDWFINLSRNRAVLSALGLASVIYMITFFITEMQLSYDLPGYMVKYKIIPSDRLAKGATVFVTGFLISALISLNRNKFNQTGNGNHPKIWMRLLTSSLGLLVVFIIFIGVRTTLTGFFDNRLIIGLINLGATVITGFWIYEVFPKFVLRVFDNNKK